MTTIPSQNTPLLPISDHQKQATSIANGASLVDMPSSQLLSTPVAGAEMVSVSQDGSLMLLMQGYFSGLSAEAQAAALEFAQASDNSDLRVAADEFQSNEASRPLVTAIEMSSLDSQAQQLSAQGYQIIVKDNANLSGPVDPIDIQTPLINPLIQQMLQDETGFRLDLSSLQSTPLAQQLTQDYDNIKEQIPSRVDAQAAAVLLYTVGMGVGVGQTPVHDLNSAVKFNYYLETARETVDQLVVDSTLASDLHSLLDRSEALQNTLQEDIIGITGAALQAGGLSAMTSNMVAGRHIQARDVQALNAAYRSYVDSPLPSFAELSTLVRDFPVPASSSADIAKTLSYFEPDQRRHQDFINGDIEIHSSQLAADLQQVQAMRDYAEQLQGNLNEQLQAAGFL